VWLRSARGITIGGSRESDFNDISFNFGWGILATGFSRGSALTGNNVFANLFGGINTFFSFGLSSAAANNAQIL